jgi:hypothetical protein
MEFVKLACLRCYELKPCFVFLQKIMRQAEDSGPCWQLVPENRPMRFKLFVMFRLIFSTTGVCCLSATRKPS